MTTPTTETVERFSLIIHHLSDLHFQQTSQRDQAALVKYAHYLQEQPREKRPSIVVITGDLTANGNRNELETVASNLKIAFPEWSGNLRQHIYVVPGPHDVCWTGTNPPSFKEFYEIFGEFALPSQTGSIPENLLAAQTVPYRVYPLNTTYTPDLPLDGISDEHRGHIKYFKRFRSLYRSRWRQRRRRTDEARKLFLDLTEGNQLTILDAGTIEKRDLDAFLSWKPVETSGSQIAESLKIIVTHHPLLIHPDFRAETRTENEVTKRFHDLLEAARRAKFHLAFHGHLHKPQVLSDLSITEGTDMQHSMQQIGAGSLGDKDTFNEVVATYDAPVNQWRFEIRTISVLTTQSSSSPSLVLMNPDKDPIKLTAKLNQTLRRRQRFEQEMRTAMRQFTESVESEKQLDPRYVKLPQVAMSSVERIIREIIFSDDFDVRVALAIKAVDPIRHIVELRNTYIVPPLEGEPRTLLYPASVASWAVILGRTLLYPKMAGDALQPDDIAWITQNNKLTVINQALEMLIQEASDSTSAKGRYENLRTALQQLGKRPLYIRDLFQPTPTGQLQPYPFFVAVPIPLRSQTGSAGLPEIGALDISLRERKKDGQQSAQAADDKEDMFSPERINMLETLADFCTQILCSADALERPKGSWGDWIKR